MKRGFTGQHSSAPPRLPFTLLLRLEALGATRKLDQVGAWAGTEEMGKEPCFRIETPSRGYLGDKEAPSL